MKKYILTTLLIIFSCFEWAQKSKPGNGKIVFKFEKPNLTEYNDLYQLLGGGQKTKKQLMRILQTEINSRINLPQNITITFTDDLPQKTLYGSAYYDPNTKRITFPYPYLKYLFDGVSPLETSSTQKEILFGVVSATCLHELGHFLFDIGKIGLLNEEEDAADGFSMLFLLQSKNKIFNLDVSMTAINKWYFMSLETIEEKPQYSDSHSPEPRRYYDLLSLFVGKYYNINSDEIKKVILNTFVRNDENDRIDVYVDENGVRHLDFKLPVNRAQLAVQMYNDRVVRYNMALKKYLRTRPPLFKSRSENYRFFKFGIGIAQTAQNSKEFYNSTLQAITEEIGVSVFLEPKLNLTNHFSMGLKIAPTIITPKNTNSSMSIFLPVMLTSELYLGQRRLRPFVGLSVGGIYSGGWKLNSYKNLQTGITEPFKIPAKITFGVSPRVGLIFGKIRADFEYNWMAGKVQTLSAPEDADVKDGVYFGTGNLEVLPINRNHFTLRFGIDIGGGKKNKQWRD